jgi:hypothetical protein
MEFAAFTKVFRSKSLLVHPDKCKLKGTSDAFHILDKAYKTADSEGSFNKLKAAFKRKKDKEAAEAKEREAANLRAAKDVVPEGERVKRLRDEEEREFVLEARRKGEEAAAKRLRAETAAAEQLEKAGVLKQEAAAWKSVRF